MNNSKNVLLEMRHITKTYPNVVANDDVSIKLFKNEILAIVGENGAGKTTLMKILYGLEKADSGEIYFKGKQVVCKNPSETMKLGIGMLQQHFMLFGSMTVAENIVYQNEPHNSVFFDKRESIRVVEELSRRYALDVDPTATVEQCPVGLQQRIEILKILYQNADIIIFDEPSAVLTPLEVEDLLKTMEQLCKMGKSIILITHKLSEVMAVSDRVIVMRDGQVVAESITRDTDIFTLSFHVINRQLKAHSIKPKQHGRTMLHIKNLYLKNSSGKEVLRDINIHVDSGEIVGIAGVSGNGQTELVRCITGIENYDGGEIYIKGARVEKGSVNKTRAAGLSYIPEDRYLWGSAPDATLFDNILMGNEAISQFNRHGILKMREIRKYSNNLIDLYDVKAGKITQKLKELSGGNAQKLIAAREIAKNTPVLIASEPTRGIDIGASEFIHEKLIEKRNQDDSVLLVSSELSEIMKLSDRIYVIFEGRINGEFVRGSIDEKSLGILMLGGRIEKQAQ